MNQTFSPTRFAQLNRWFWAANGRTYSLGLLALLIITGLVLGRVLAFNGYDAAIARNNIPYFLILSVIAVFLLGSYLFGILHDQNSSLLYLMLPASRTEKFALAILYTFLFVIGYSLSYLAIEALFFQLANTLLPATGKLYQSELLSTPDERMTDLSLTSYALMLTAALSVLSSLYFRRGVLVKSLVLFLCLFFGLTVLYGYVLSAFFPGLETHVRAFFGDVYVHPKGQYANAPLLPAPGFIKYVFPWLVLGALWIAARIRFNEIER